MIYGRVKVPKTADVIWGQLKNQSGKQAAAQAIRFPVKNWTAAQARKWLKDNKVKYIKFEPAAPSKKKENILIDSQTTQPAAGELAAIQTNWIICLDFITVSRQTAEQDGTTVTEAMKKVRRQQPELYENYRENL